MTRRYSTEFSAWSSDRPFETLLNYTYTPWNKTSNSAFEFQDPQVISIQANSSSVGGTDWLFNSTSNVSQVHFSSNQSISIEYDLTLRYKQNITSKSTLFIGSSGSDVTWNITSVADFPELSGSQDKNLTLDLPDDWIAEHLFNLTNPTQYYDHYSQNGPNVVCFDLGDETWVLKCTSPNYLQSIMKYDSSDDSTINDKVPVSVIMDINSTIESPTSEIALNGEASLRVFYQESLEYSENYSVTGGMSYHQWDISSHFSSNGLHTIDISWMNGTEAGYRTSDVLVYYETSLVADEYTINAFTDNSFYIGIDFDQIFPVGGIDGSAADVTYSFGAVVNQSLDDQTNGRWDATVSTTSVSPGTYDLYVYAEGYALENKSLTIQVSLIHDTEPLIIVWSNTNNITYIETTELTVYYNRVTGSTPIPDAVVNVTIDTKEWSLEWDGSAYKITFNGTDIPPGFGEHNLFIEALKTGHKSQFNDTQVLIIQEEPTTMTYEWSNSDSITYIESTTLIVNYTKSDGSPVVGAIVNVTIGTDNYNLTWNGATYEYIFDGDSTLPGFGDHSLSIQADKHGHAFKYALSVPLTITEEPTTMTYQWLNGNVITYIGSTTLIVNYTMSDGSPVVGAIVNVTIGSLNPFFLVFNGTVYEYVFDGDASPGIGVWSLTIKADKHGHVYRNATSVSLTIDEEPTTLDIKWSPGNIISYVGQTYLIANYTMSNGSPVLGALVNVTIGTYPPWTLEWDDSTQTYRVLFKGIDNPPGIDTHSLTIQADLLGFAEKSDTAELTINEESTNLYLIWSNDNSITFIQQTTLSANYTMANGTAIREAMVNVSIGGYPPLELSWHEGSQTYQITFYGTDDPPGFGNHTVLVLADLFGFNFNSNSSYLKISEEPTSIDILWSNGTSITYVQHTTLSVTYRRNDTTPIPVDANVTALIGSTLFNLTWNPGNQAYEITFNGTDSPPDIGYHNVIIEASKFGYQTQMNDTYWLRIDIELTSLELTWWVSNTITYVQQTVLYVNFSMSDGSPVRSAYVNATIGTGEWIFEWNDISEMYMLIISGNHPDIGLGSFQVILNASLYGFEQQNSDSETLNVIAESTYLDITWSNGNATGFFEHTFLFVDYRMSNDTTILNATLSVTIGSTTWDMVWNETALRYQVRFNGSDSPPGVGEHSLTIQASKYGFAPQTDDTQLLTLPVIPTYIEIIWSNGDTITFIQQTTLRVKYAMYNDTIISGLGTNVYLSIGAIIYPLSLVGDYYERTFYGTDKPPGFGNHSTVIQAYKNDFESHMVLDEYLTINEEPTSFVINWSNGYDISYLSGTTLSVRYQDSNFDVIQDAILNVTINGRFWNLTWNSGNSMYETYIAGNENPPGYGTHNVKILAFKYGYVALNNTYYNLTIRLEETSIFFGWAPSNTITFVEHTKIRIFYLNHSGYPIEGATINITIGFDRWDVIFFNSTSGAYEWSWTGMDNPPGVGSHLLTIRAWKLHHVGITDISQSFTIDEEPTQITASWSPGNSITSVQSTKLLVNFTDSYGTVIPDGIVEVISGAYNEELMWNATSELYEIVIYGWDLPLGSHSLLIEGHVLVGYKTAVNSSMELTILSEQVSIYCELLQGDTISYIGYTILAVNYTMSN
ncbi:MAG: hypothetical protein ACFFEE_07820, partial [Candidatus Thorarchaeota archaeon]